ncbi:caffeine resistance protein [Dentipellis sp. KUC8613]|nr:caffeine resistance protein [Dentipellis sp. KUC8613]
MDIVLRESTFGQLANYFTHGRAFPYPNLPSRSSSPNFEKPNDAKPVSADVRPVSSDIEAASGEAKSGSSDDKTVPTEVRPVPGDIKLVDWSGPDDPDMPCNWPRSTKLVTTANIMFMTFAFYLASAIYTSGIPAVESRFDATQIDGTLGLSLFVIAYGVGPLLLSPLSSVPSIGRSPVYVVGMFIFFVLQIGTAEARNLQTVLVLRFFAGFAGSPSISTGGASLSEIYDAAHRAYAISLWACAAVAAPVMGPLLGAALVRRYHTWAAPIWLIMGLSAVSVILLIFTLPETSYDNILHRRARRLRQQTGDSSYRTQGEIDAACRSLTRMVAKQVVDDIMLAFVDPIILFLNLHIMLLYGLLYLWFEFFPFVFGGIYGFTPVEQGLAFFGILVGTVISYIGYTIWLRYRYVPMMRRVGADVQPESRLPPAQIGSFCVPICLFVFAWTSRASVHWIVPIIGTAFFAPGIYLSFQSVLNYLGDAYPRYVAGVFAGNAFWRSVVGGALPLAAPSMLRSLNIDWASSTLGFISIAMVPIPFVLDWYGAKIRSWSRLAN